MRLEEKLTVLRKESRYTQLDLAEKVRVSRQAISKWETGRALPSMEKLKYLSELFGVSVDYLLNDDMTEEPKPKEQKPAPEPQTKEPQTEEAVFPEKEKGKPVRWKYIAALLLAVLLGLLIGVFVGKYSERHIRPHAKLSKAVKVADTSDQGEAESKALSPVAVTLGEDTKPFDKTDGVFNKDTFS